MRAQGYGVVTDKVPTYSNPGGHEQAHRSVIDKVETGDSDLFDTVSLTGVDGRGTWEEASTASDRIRAERTLGADVRRAVTRLLNQMFLPQEAPMETRTAVLAPASTTSATGRSAQRSANGTREKGAGATTLVLQGLPYEFCRDDVVAMLEENGFQGYFDFVYVPSSFDTGSSFGYAFVNMISPSKAAECWLRFDGFSAWPRPNSRVCAVFWADIQGLEANIEKYRNSSVMHRAVPDGLKPIILGQGGVRRAFPPPTQRIKAPKPRKQGQTSAQGEGEADAL